MTFCFARRVHFSDSTNEAPIDVSEKIEHIIPMFGIMWVLAFLLPFVCYSFPSFRYSVCYSVCYSFLKMTDIDVLVNDPFYKLMESGEIMWGDLMMDVVCEEVQPVAERTMEEEILEGWTMPDLKLRKNIWENFPVSLIPLADADGTDRYAVVWHEKNLEEWRSTRALSWDEFQEYEDYACMRLMYALRAHSHKYRIEEARSSRHVCVIAMVHSDTVISAIPVVPTTVIVPSAAVIVATRSSPKAMNVLKGFAVSWDRDTLNSKIHFIKPHMMKLKALGLTGKDIESDLMNELSLCDDCVVSDKVRGDYLCTVRML